MPLPMKVSFYPSLLILALTTMCAEAQTTSAGPWANPYTSNPNTSSPYNQANTPYSNPYAPCGANDPYRVQCNGSQTSATGAGATNSGAGNDSAGGGMSGSVTSKCGKRSVGSFGGASSNGKTVTDKCTTSRGGGYSGVIAKPKSSLGFGASIESTTQNGRGTRKIGQPLQRQKLP